MSDLENVPRKRLRRNPDQVRRDMLVKGITEVTGAEGFAEYHCSRCRKWWKHLKSAEAHCCPGSGNTSYDSALAPGSSPLGSRCGPGREVDEVVSTQDDLLQALQHVVDVLESTPSLLEGRHLHDPGHTLDAADAIQSGHSAAGACTVQGGGRRSPDLAPANARASEPAEEASDAAEAAAVNDCSAAVMAECTELEYEEQTGGLHGMGLHHLMGRARGGWAGDESTDDEADLVNASANPQPPVPANLQPVAAAAEGAPAAAAEGAPVAAAEGAPAAAAAGGPAAAAEGGPAAAAEGGPAAAAEGGPAAAADGGPAAAAEGGPAAAAEGGPAAGAHPGQEGGHNEGGAGGRRRRPRVGTGQWFRDNRAKPIVPESEVTVVQACHWLATLKSDCRMTDEAVDKVCLMVNKFLLPEGNLFPPSYHLVKETLGVTSSKACTQHICDKCWSVYPHLEPDTFRDHADETCQARGIAGCLDGICGNPRFNRSDTGVIVPKRCLYEFDIAETVCDLLEVMLGDLEAVLEQRSEDFRNPATLMGSPAGKQLDAACGWKFSNPPPGELAVPFAFGGDGAQVFLNRIYGVLICGLRLTEAPPGMAAKNVTWAPVSVVQGPTEPKSYHGVLEKVLEFFVKHDPGRPGSTPLEVKLQDGQVLKVWPVLSHAEGDIPFMTKLMNSVAHNATMACFHCAIEASYCMAARTNRWLGYYKPLVQGIPCHHQSGRMLTAGEMAAVDWTGANPRMARGYVSDDPWGSPDEARMASTTIVSLGPKTWVNMLKYSALEKMYRGLRAKRLTAEVMTPTLVGLTDKTADQRERIVDDKLKKLGVRGEPFFSGLSYFNPSQFFRLGIAHVFLLGLLKDFWNHWLQPVKNAWTEFILPVELRAIITARGDQLQQTELFGKPYTDLIKYRGCWMMEEWLAFTETFALYLLQDLPWPAGSRAIRQVFEEQWSLLRPAVLYFMKYEQGQHTEQRILQAQGWLLRYGESAERVFKGRSLTTFKLHLAAAHLADQVRACGAGFFSTEYWIERMVQVLKRMIKYRSTAYPELLFIHDWLLVLACRRVRRTDEGKDLTTLEEALEILRAAKRKVHDEPDAVGAELLGAPHTLTDEEVAEVLPQYEPPPDPFGSIPLSGLPKLLHSDARLDKMGWPTFRGDPDQVRARWIFTDLGLGGPMEEPRPVDVPPRVWVELQKFRRARLPIEESISCVQCTTQKKKNNQWGLVIWDVRAEDGSTYSEMCAVQFQYMVRAQLRTDDERDIAMRGLGLVGEAPQKALPLKLVMAKVFLCQARVVPGMRPLSDKSAEQLQTELPELLKLVDTRPADANRQYCGHWLLELCSINSQLVPTKELQTSRHFMVANKSSGRSVSVKR